jgi:hypothetical protein
MQTYYIIKGSKKVYSFYLTEFPVKFVHYLNKNNKENDFKVDNLGFFQRLTPLKMFPIRQNSNIFFKEFTEAKNYIEYAKQSINNDDRFCKRIKTELLNYIETFKIITN